MIRKLILASLLLGLTATATKAEDVYNIDPMHSEISFSVSHMVINTVRGKFKDFKGQVWLDGKQPTKAEGTIEAKSVDTGVEKRDAHLRSDDFFAVSKFPEISFKTKSVEKDGNSVTLVGDFTMHGVTKEVKLPVTVKGPIKDPMGSIRIGLQTSTKLNRSDYGLKYNAVLEAGGLAIGEDVTIEINAEAIKAVSKS
jgi:polyisoprenoid-binding protein YceI